MKTALALVHSTPTLQQALSDAAMKFAHGILNAIRTAPMHELASFYEQTPKLLPARPAPVLQLVQASPKQVSKRDRRTHVDIADTLGLILALLESHPNGLRTEQIRVKLGIPRAKLILPLAKGVESGVLEKSGHKRTMTFRATNHG